ncbi:zinc-binding dehydrogenase [Streptomyces sp. DSM 41524]|uniref:Zinc-binding dehydrogenase n=1 Tax=Streptomyces asiaticus subsp. ignotus TaxID=3098222 RepID=A0ABU7PQ85_9ACTN|nr:zinc-binding dehydrogenase [Streptomyces sp. DSM 41524]
MGDRVHGAATGRAAADFVVVGPSGADTLRRTPAETGDEVACTLAVAGMTAAAALALGVPAERISTVAAGPNPPGGVRPTGGMNARPEDLKRIADAIVAGEITVPIAATFPIEQIREAVRLQAGRHVHGTIVVNL